ncbi:MAG: type II toxin-antitoxin system RelE/ParE family toxin [Candidatus Acidiferrum sp.]
MSRSARANLRAEADYIADDNPAAADRVAQRIRLAIDLLRRDPAIGRPGRVLGTRELAVGDALYIIPYRVRADAVEILRVFDAAQKCPQKFWSARAG